jgi:hypothetical protein
MFDISLNLKNINAATLVQRIRATVSSMTGNAAFTTPDPALAGLTSKANALEAKATARDTAKTAAKTLTAETDDLAAELKDEYKKLASYVGKTAQTEAQVQSANMAVKSKPAARPVPDRVEGLELSPGDNDGEIDAQWDPDDDATNYDVETSVDPVTASSWAHHSNGSNSRTTLTGLTSGARMWVRVRGTNAVGKGPWSDPAVKRVP